MTDLTLTHQSLIRRGQVWRTLPGRGSQRSENRDEQGLLMLGLAIVLTTVLSVMAVTITTGAVDQLQFSSNATNRDGALQGALAGVQTMVAQIRAASSGGYAVLSELPCSNFSGLTNTSGSSSFIASVQYQDQNSQGKFVNVSCTQGQGPAAASPGSFLARAVITSCSPASACPTSPTAAITQKGIWRRVVSTYDFNTSYANIPGGLIYSYSGEECFVATYNNGSSPSGGVTLEVTTACLPNAPLEQFQYTSNWDLAIQLGGVQYCVQDPEDGSPASALPLAITTSCTTTGAPQWGINDVGDIEGVAASGSGQPNGYCLDNPLSSDPSGNLTEDATVGSCDSGFDNTSTWQLSSDVGAGASQPASGQLFGVTDQLVNFEEFGNCLDVTNQNSSWPFLIDYMCKQFPDTTDYPVWNQRWCFDQLSTNSDNLPVGVLYTPQGQTTCSSPSSPYCLKSPLQTPGQLPSTVWVTVTSCTLGSSLQNQTNLLWTEWGSKGGSLHEYTWTDNAGLCLESNTSNPAYPASASSAPFTPVGDAFSTIQVDTCDGSYEQKWNAPAILGQSQIVNTHEGTGSGAYSGP